jgi:hypothetical protein
MQLRWLDFCRFWIGASVGNNMSCPTNTDIGGCGACINGIFSGQKLNGGVANEGCRGKKPKIIWRYSP